MIRPGSLLLFMAILALLAVHAPFARAQDRLPQDVITADPLAGPQEDQVDTFADFWVDQLLNGDAPQVSEARRKLIEYLTIPGSSAAFRDALNKAIIERFDPVVKSDRLITRLNGMIVVNYLTDTGAFGLVGIGLQDQSPAVRYWAAKAVAQITQRGQLAAGQQQQLLQLLEQGLGNEEDAAVLAELLKALNALNIPAAKDALITALGEQVKFFRAAPDARFQTLYDAMQALYIDLIRLDAQNPGGVNPQITELARVALLYNQLAAEQLKNDPDLSPELINDKAQMVKLTDTILRFAVDTLAPGSRKPDPIDNAITFKDWDFVLVQADRWRQTLRRSPFNFTEEQLAEE